MARGDVAWLEVMWGDMGIFGVMRGEVGWFEVMWDDMGIFGVA